MKLGFELTIDDLIAFNEHYAAERFGYPERGRRVLRFCVIFGLFFAGMYIVLRSPGASKTHSIYWLAALVISVVWWFVTPKLVSWLARRQFLKVLNTPGNASMTEYREMTLSPDGLAVVLAQSSSNHKWESIQRTEEVSDYFYVYLTDISSYVIPKSKIMESEAVELRALFAEYVKSDNKN